MTMTVQTLPQATVARFRSTSSGAAPLRNNGYRVLQVVLFVSGAVLLPLGLVVIILGWYGAAHTAYQYDQLSYLVSGGLLGLGCRARCRWRARRDRQRLDDPSCRLRVGGPPRRPAPGRRRRPRPHPLPALQARVTYRYRYARRVTGEAVDIPMSV
jgi:hypothetical protein